MTDPSLHQVLVPLPERRPAPVLTAEQEADENRKRSLRAHRKRLSAVLAGTSLHDPMMEAFAALIDRRPVQHAEALRARLLEAVAAVPFDVMVRLKTSPDELAASAAEVTNGQ